ncbi:hypothetical protein CHS0354_016236 [Potamilus streckersoni]|uniref:Translocation protein SEC62 n=1 Tax=Potamilus streckersoni TaxID=2493646 RepID=A0AAE0RXQ8_9BIVA|nr:hypothetical protein CHS0354_016236 [Potamilus streckersoni]
MRFSIMVHEGRLAGMSVKCFLASDAIDCLMESKWAKGKSADPSGEIFFKDRLSCQHFCQRLLEKGLFHRADKKERSKEERSKDREKSKKKKKDTTESIEGKKDKKEKKSKKDSEKEVEKTDENKENKEEKKEEKKEGDKKGTKPKRYKLTMSEDQRFLDGNNVYVWIYDPIHPKTFSIGLLMVLGAVALCLFPLWPDWMRIGVYYLSILGATFVGLTLFLIVLRVILFAFVWLVTLGTHHLWIFPNLTEDVGILESFRPLYMHEKYVAVKKDKKEKEENENASIELVQKKDSESGIEENDKNGFEIVETYDVEDDMDEMVDDNADEYKDDEDSSDGDENDIEDEDKKRK